MDGQQGASGPGPEAPVLLAVEDDDPTRERLTRELGRYSAD